MKVLIAEDELIIADSLEATLVDAGYEVCGIARTVAEAVSLGRAHSPDLAIIDLCLANGDLGSDIVAELADERMGVLYATANASRLAVTLGDGQACIAKPYGPEDLLRGLEVVAEIVATGKTSLPFPRGFRVLPLAPPRTQGGGTADDAARVRKLLRQQAAIAHFGSFALRESDVLKVLTEAARVCAEGLDVPFSKVCCYRAEENDLLIVAGYGWQTGIIGHVISRADESSPQGRTFITGKPCICNDLRKDSEFQLPAFYAAHGIISTIDVLIKGGGQPYGVLEIDNDKQHDYDEHDIIFLTAFANILAEAVATSVRTAMLETTIREKDQLLEQKKVMTRELQHRVRNNLQLVQGMLQKQMGDTMDAVSQRGIKAIARRVSTLAQVHDHLLGAGMTRTTDFGAYVKSLCLSLGELQGAPNVVLSCDCDPLPLDLDVVTALGIVAAELVSNSYDHAFPNGKGSTRVTVRRASDGDGMAVMTVLDDGQGFKDSGDSKRHGLGLVRRLVEQVRGTLMVKSDQGTTWTIKFPAPPGTTIVPMST